VPSPVLVVIPTRDRPALLAEALASVIAQDDPDWVAVVADDGDGEPVERAHAAVLPRDPRIAYCRATTRTAGGARNAAMAFGEERVLRREPTLVAFLDDDDLWRPGHLRASREALDARPGAAFVHGAAVTRGPDGESPYHARESGPLEGDLFLPLLRRDLVATSSVVAPWAAVSAVGRFRADLRHAQDWDLWLKLAQRGPAAFVPAPLVVYRDHAGNVSKRLVAKGEDQAEMLSTWWRRRHGLSKAERGTLRHELARRHRRLVKRLLDAGRLPRAEVRRLAWARFKAVPHALTLQALLEASVSPRGHAPPEPDA
jgi:glycosyltransferase involved in cell wall biosynthesis